MQHTTAKRSIGAALAALLACTAFLCACSTATGGGSSSSTSGAGSGTGTDVLSWYLDGGTDNAAGITGRGGGINFSDKSITTMHTFSSADKANAAAEALRNQFGSSDSASISVTRNKLYVKARPEEGKELPYQKSDFAKLSSSGNIYHFIKNKYAKADGSSGLTGKWRGTPVPVSATSNMELKSDGTYNLWFESDNSTLCMGTWEARTGNYFDILKEKGYDTSFFSGEQSPSGTYVIVNLRTDSDLPEGQAFILSLLSATWPTIMIYKDGTLYDSGCLYLPKSLP